MRPYTTACHRYAGITCLRYPPTYSAQSSISRRRRSNKSDRAYAASTWLCTLCASAAVTSWTTGRPTSAARARLPRRADLRQTG